MAFKKVGFLVAIVVAFQGPSQSEFYSPSGNDWSLDSSIEVAEDLESWVSGPTAEPVQVAAAEVETVWEQAGVEDDFTSKFARPVTDLNFNHPFIWNEFRPVFIHHEFPDDSALGGGNARIYAAQVWLKLTDRLQFVADKDGYVDFNPGGLPNEEGWADIATGLKYNLIKDPANEFMLSIGGIYEWTNGSGDVFQGQGDGIWDLFVSTAKGSGRTHFIGTAGFQIPMDRSEDSTVFHYHAHIDYDLCPKFTPLVELNGYHYLDNGNRNGGLGAPLDFEGFDFTSFGSSNVEGNDVVTMGVGFRTPINARTTFGAAYEWSLTGREDLFEERITCDLSYRF